MWSSVIMAALLRLPRGPVKNKAVGRTAPLRLNTDRRALFPTWQCTAFEPDAVETAWCQFYNASDRQ